MALRGRLHNKAFFPVGVESRRYLRLLYKEIAVSEVEKRYNERVYDVWLAAYGDQLEKVHGEKTAIAEALARSSRNDLQEDWDLYHDHRLLQIEIGMEQKKQWSQPLCEYSLFR